MANLFQPSLQRANDENGNPVSGAKMFFYLTGTTAPATWYTDQAGEVPGTNPLVADSAGLWAPAYLDPDITYRVRRTAADGETLIGPDADPLRGFDESAFVTTAAQVSDDADQVAADRVAVAADKATVAADKATVASDKDTVAADKALTEGYRDAALAGLTAADVYTDTTVAAAITAGLAAVADTETFYATGDDVDYVGLYRDNAGSEVELTRIAKPSALDTALGQTATFPGYKDASTAEQAAMDSVSALQFFGVPDDKYLLLKYGFWNDVTGRFNFTWVLADDEDGTNAVEAVAFVVAPGGGADAWTFPKTIELIEYNDSGVTGSFRFAPSGSSLTVTTVPASGAAWQIRRTNLNTTQSSAARAADIAALAADGLNIRDRTATVSYFHAQAGNDTQTGSNNAGFGDGSLTGLTTGIGNTAFGVTTGGSITTASYNSLFGNGAGGNVSGAQNAIFGWQAAFSAAGLSFATVFGAQAGYSLTTGTNDVFGYRALFSCVTGSASAAFGTSALLNFTGSGAAAFGVEAGYSATTATNLTVIGRRAAYTKVTGADDTYVGFSAGFATAGKANNSQANTGVGAYALGHATGGGFNAACGRAAGWYGDDASNNAWLGYRCGYGLATGNNNVGVGYYSLHNLNLGNRLTFIGATADAVIPDTTSTSATPVAGSGLEIGQYSYRIAFVLDGVETALSEPPLSPTTTSGNQQVDFTGIPIYTGPRTCSARKIYRTPVGGENLYYLVGTISDNSTTTFSDTTADGSLATQPTAINDAIALGFGATVLKSNQMVVGSVSSRITEVYIGGGVDDTAPEDMLLSSSNASGTNVAGSDLTLRGGLGTGSGSGGRVVLSAAPAGSSGTTHTAAVEVLAIDGRGFQTVKETTSASVPTPDAGFVNLFFESGSLKFRNSAGTVLTVSAS